jgi:hypothetical protein
LTGLN